MSAIDNSHINAHALRMLTGTLPISPQTKISSPGTIQQNVQAQPIAGIQQTTNISHIAPIQSTQNFSDALQAVSAINTTWNTVGHVMQATSATLDHLVAVLPQDSQKTITNLRQNIAQLVGKFLRKNQKLIHIISIIVLLVAIIRAKQNTILLSLICATEAINFLATLSQHGDNNDVKESNTPIQNLPDVLTPSKEFNTAQLSESISPSLNMSTGAGNILPRVTYNDCLADAEDYVWKMEKMIRECPDLPEDVRETIIVDIQKARQNIRQNMLPE